MSAVKLLNPNADIIGQRHALQTNVAAARGLAGIVKSNLGPKGSLKMLVGGAGQVKLTKDGKVLLDEMPIQHPTALLIARTATAQDEITGDGTTSTVLFTAELLRQAERQLQEGLHPRTLVDGFEIAREATLEFLDTFKRDFADDEKLERETIIQVARSSLRTKVYEKLADHLAEIVTDAVTCVHQPEKKQVDLHMVEVMHMRHRSDLDTRFVNGLVLDHGARHPNMAKRSERCHILTLNVSLEYEKSEVNAAFFYKTAADREKLVKAERKFTDDKVQAIIDFKEKVCAGTDDNFVVINQKGIDPPSLDMLQRAGIVGLRRAKRRNMERLALACGGHAVNSTEDLEPDCLGWADLVYEHTLGDDKFTFVEGCRNPSSCTVLIRGPSEYQIRQIQDAIRDGLRAVTNIIEDRAMVPGAAAFEVAAHVHLLTKTKPATEGKAKLGVQAFAEALLTIPKQLADNAGLDATDTVIKLLEASAAGLPAGLDIETGDAIDPSALGIWDSFRVKRQFVHLGGLIATKLLLVDEVMRAGRKMGKN